MSGITNPAALDKRRAFPRFTIPPDLVTMGSGERGIGLNISEGGLAIRSFVPLTPGTTRTFQFKLPGTSRSFVALGSVAWVGAGGRAGVRFLDLPAQARVELHDRFRPEFNPQKHAGSLVSRTTSLIDIHATLELIADRAQSIVAADGVAVALGDGSSMVCHLSRGTAPDAGVCLLPDAGLSGECLRTGDVVHCADTQSDARVNAEAAAALDVRAILILPVYAGYDLAGVIELLSAKPNAFDARQVTRLERLAELMGAALAEARQGAEQR